MTDTFFENNDCTICMMEGDARASALSGECDKPYDVTIEGFRGRRGGRRRWGGRRWGGRRYWGYGGYPWWGYGGYPYYRYPRTTVIKQQAPANGTYKTVAWVALAVAVMTFMTSRK